MERRRFGWREGGLVGEKFGCREGGLVGEKEVRMERRGFGWREGRSVLVAKKVLFDQQHTLMMFDSFD